MIHSRTITRAILFYPLALMFVACAGAVDKNIEDAQFLLDKAEFAKAETKARAALVADPNSSEAKYVLAESLMGQSALGDGETFVTLLGRLLLEPDAGESGLETFGRIAPNSDSETRAKLEEARDTLLDIPEPERSKEVYLQIMFARMLEVSVYLNLIGAADSTDLLCNATGTAGTDGVPDGFTDPDALSADQSARFQDNLDSMPSDAESAGFPADFVLIQRTTDLASELATAQDLADFLKNQIGDPADAGLCN